MTGPALLCVAVVLTFQYPTAEAPQASGSAEIVFSLAPGHQPEGIAVHRTGDVFVGNRHVTLAGTIRS